MSGRRRFLAAPFILLALLAAIWAGLVRLGWGFPPILDSLPAVHGPLMVSGFVGALISLERAVALDRGWAYAGPLLAGGGAVLLIAGVGGQAGPLLITVGSLSLLVVSAVIVRRQPALFTYTMALGALAWLVGNGLWLTGQPLGETAGWWIAFPALVILGERLELSRVIRPPAISRWAYAGALGIVAVGLLLSLVAHDAGVRLLGLGLVALAVWLARYDVARRTVRQSGLTRYIALNLLAAYAWLGASGLLAAWFGGVTAGPRYDAWLHTFFVGFVFGMIFAHALVILPAISGQHVPYHRLLYGPVILLHVALVMRVLGDLVNWTAGRQWGGLLNGVAILGFFLQIIVLAARERRRAAQGTTAAATGR